MKGQSFVKNFLELCVFVLLNLSSCVAMDKMQHSMVAAHERTYIFVLHPEYMAVAVKPSDYIL